jgi:hypothetical protein
MGPMMQMRQESPMSQNPHWGCWAYAAPIRSRYHLHGLGVKPVAILGDGQAVFRIKHGPSSFCQGPLPPSCSSDCLMDFSRAMPAGTAG